MSGLITTPYDWTILSEMKEAGRRIVALTAYSAKQARLIAPWVDFILVGDSVAMVWHKGKTTQEATMPMMTRHGKWVVRGAAGRAPVVVDLPECAYYRTDPETKRRTLRPPEEILANATILMTDTACAALKLEGGVELAPSVKLLVQNNIPVMGHIGLLPSQFGANDKYLIAGKGQEAAQNLIDDARSIQEAGAFAIVIEGSSEPVATFIATKVLTIPTIGIGASPDTSGQILVNRDIWNKATWRPKFAMCFQTQDMRMQQAVMRYAMMTKYGLFPDRENHCYPHNPEKSGVLDVYALR